MCTVSVRLRLMIIAALVALSLWAVYPPAEKINLGLDLRGGLQLVLRVRTADALRQETRIAAEQLQEQLTRGGARADKVDLLAGSQFVITGVDDGEALGNAAAGLAGRFDRISSGSSHTFTAETGSRRAAPPRHGAAGHRDDRAARQ